MEKMFGGPVVFPGMWQLDAQNHLTWTFEFKDEEKRESGAISVDGNDMIMIMESGVTKRLGRFTASLDDPC